MHLSQTHPRDDADPLWMRYRWSDYHPDADFEAFVTRLIDTCGSDSIALVFNGDLFDFDAPVVKDGTSTFDEYLLDEQGCSGQVQRIIEDHPRFFGAVGKILALGHSVVFISGNHDVELYWPEVRRVLREALRDAARVAARAAPQEGELDLEDFEARVSFRTWFHVTPDGIYLEHGSQYDMINGVADPMRPLRSDGTRIHPICGKLVFKRVGARLGYFNPYCEDTFYMGLFDYLGHFIKHYLFSKRHIARTWAFGAAATALEIARYRRPHPPNLPEESVARAHTETRASRAAILATHALRVPSAEQTMLPILRELWIDRVLLFIMAVAIASTCFAFTSLTTAIIVMVVLILLFIVYELVSPKPDVRSYDSAPPRVERLLEIHGARALCMGHTHRPFGIWREGTFWGNSGSWCPAFVDRECTKPVLEGRPFLWLSTDAADAADVPLWGGLHWFRQGSFTPDPKGTRQRADQSVDETKPKAIEETTESALVEYRQIASTR